MARNASRPLALGLLAALLPALALADLPAPPATPKKRATDTYHGVQVADDYQWLEKTEDKEVRKWVDAQNLRTRAYFNALPAHKAVQRKLRSLANGSTSRFDSLHTARGTLFAVKDNLLVTLASPDDPASARVLVDPDKELPKRDAAIDAYTPSHDAKLVAVSMSENGREESVVYVFEVATGKRLPDKVPATGGVAWKRDNTGFWYVANPRDEDNVPEERRHQYEYVYFHKLGTDVAEDAYVIGKEFPKLAGVALDASDDGRYLLAAVTLGTDRECACHLLGPSGKWVQLSDFKDEITGVLFGPKDTLYLISERGAPRGEVLALSLDRPELKHAKKLVPQSDGVMVDLLATPGRLYVVDRVEGSARLRAFDHDGKDARTVPLKPSSAITQMLRWKGDQMLFQQETYLEPAAWYRYDPASGKAARTALAVKSKASFPDAEVLRAFAQSKDGTKVPLTILRRKGTKLDGNNPVLLSGYGAYGTNEEPNFQAARRVWLDAGGVYAIAHIRGDGEYGSDWHHAGRLTKKQNSFDDFYACARWLIDNKYTNPNRLAIEGASNGGLLMNAMLTQHPDTFRVVVAHVGIADMLRFERHPNGSLNVTEFGTVADKAHFEALFAYSPYHRVKDGTNYPAVLLTTGINDTRVSPAQSWKMAARLQASGTKRPVLLWTSLKSGHDLIDRDEEVNVQADVFAFLFDQLGVKYPPPGQTMPKAKDDEEPQARGGWFAPPAAVSVR